MPFRGGGALPAGAPPPTLPSMDLSRLDLPLAPHLPEISAALAGGRLLVLSAEPGAGKSTLVPPFLMEEPWLAGRKILMLEPRRLAAAAVSARMADLLGEPLGRRAGYRVRASSRVSRETRIEVVTEALLTRAIQEDPLLAGVGLVIFDEFHERSIHADLALALTLEVRRARPDLAVLIMSATMDSGRTAAHLGGAPVLHFPGRLFPVETRHAPLPDKQRWEDGLAGALPRVMEETHGDVLVFLPGVPEIRRAAARLSAAVGPHVEIQALHGSLPLEEQRRVLAGAAGSGSSGGGDASSPAGRRRVILATSIAETSLTVPGIRVVADAGWARLTRFHPATGLDRLVTERVSGSSADQRRGRAGRLGPGVCVRFWKEGEPLQAHPEPELLRSDLAGVVLECALWGAREPDGLAWLDSPPRAAWAQAGEILGMLGLTRGGAPTDLGREVAGLGLSPRLGVLVIEGARRGAAPLAAACAALLQERDGSAITGDPDLRLRLEMARTGRGGSDAWRAGMEREITRILRRVEREGPGLWGAAEESIVGGLLAHAFPDRVARRENDGSYRFVTGRAAVFPGARTRAGTASRAAEQWIVAPETDAGETMGTIRLAAPLSPEEAEAALVPVTTEQIEIRWNRLVPRAHRFTRAGRLTLAERPAPLDPQAVAASLKERLAREGVSILPWNEKARQLLERVRFRGTHAAAAAGMDLSDQGLAERAEQWLGPCLTLTGGAVMSSEGLCSALRSLSGAGRGRLDAEVPESLVLPTGGRRRIDYSSGSPTVEARIQEVFGLAASPRICGVPVVFRLLSPASRPLQVTTDLEGFWKGSYAEVRKQMRGRYPRHYWPENPLEAEPTTRAKPRRD
jgi:ATP-dependent helicase HrpB